MGEGGRFIIFNFVVSKGKFRVFVGDEQFFIQREDYRSIIQVNYIFNYIFWLLGTFKIFIFLMLTLVLGNKILEFKEMELEKWRNFYVVGEMIFFNCEWYLVFIRYLFFY